MKIKTHMNKSEVTMKKAIIFDLDGTLWDSAAGVAESWNKVIENLPDISIKLTAEDIMGIMGLTMDTIADRFFGSVESRARRMEIMDLCGNNENDYLLEHGGILFPQLEETLKKLNEKYSLFIVSNCQSGYIEAFIGYYRFEKYFEGFTCWGDNKVSKGENISAVIRKYGIDRAVYVGDTQGDLDAADAAQIPFIHAGYGFGKPNRSVPVIMNFSELPQKAEEILM